MKEDNIIDKKPVSAPVSEASNRPSVRSEFGSTKPPFTNEDSPNTGAGSIPFQGIPSTTDGPAAQGKSTRLTRTELVRIKGHLSTRDYAVLRTIHDYRFLTSNQIGRLFITECSTKASQTRQQNLLLQRLSAHGLIRSLKRRIGGFGGGSSVKIWHLTEGGYRLLMLDATETKNRKRFSEPSAHFLFHILAVAECAVQITCICQGSEDLSLEALDPEPACWRSYSEGGRICCLKSDLFVITNYDDYEDRWFIEVDLGSESSKQIIEKCRTYLSYYYSGIEQRESEMFPLVVWVVKDNSRKAKIKEYISDNLKDHPKMFLVITPDELEKMLRQYIDRTELC